MTSPANSASPPLQNPGRVSASNAGLKFFLIITPGLPLLFFGLSRLTLFDGLYGQDAYAYLAYATRSLTSALQQSLSFPPFFWPPGYPLLIAVGGIITGKPTLTAQLISLVSGTLVPIITVLIAREIYPFESLKYPILAGFLVGLTGQLWQSSVVIMSDTPALAAATMGIWALIRHGKSVQQGTSRPGRPGVSSILWLATATAFISFAVLTRWGYALVAILCLVYTIYFMSNIPSKFKFIHFLTASLVGILVLSPILGDIIKFLFGGPVGATGFVGDLELYSWNPNNIFLRQFETTDGILSYRYPNGLYYALAPAHQFFFTPIIAPLLIPGIWFVRQRMNPHWFLILAWAGLIYLFHAGAAWQNFRFTLAYLPPLALIIGLGVFKISQWMPRKFRWILGLVIAAGFIIMAYGGWTLTNRFIERKNDNLDLLSSVEEQLPDDARLISFGLTLAHSHYFNREVLELFSQDETSLEALIKIEQPLYLLVEPALIKQQWAGRSPALNVAWLDENTQLTQVAEFQPYVLFVVE